MGVNQSGHPLTLLSREAVRPARAGDICGEANPGFPMWTSAHGFHHYSLSTNAKWRRAWVAVLSSACFLLAASFLYYSYQVLLAPPSPRRPSPLPSSPTCPWRGRRAPGRPPPSASARASAGAPDPPTLVQGGPGQCRGGALPGRLHHLELLPTPGSATAQEQLQGGPQCPGGRAAGGRQVW